MIFGEKNRSYNINRTTVAGTHVPKEYPHFSLTAKIGGAPLVHLV
jgi:hypothetical protein